MNNKSINKSINITLDQLEEVFIEWDRQYRASPETFSNESVRLLKKTDKDYGKRSSLYFIQILNKIKQR